MSLIQRLEFLNIRDNDRGGSLVALEAMKNIPFSILRAYFIQLDEKNNKPRGFHAHYQLRQVAICLQGHCRFILDDGVQREEVWLNSATQGLIVENKIWHEMHDFSPNCLLLMLADAHYDEADYIRNYEEFIAEVRNFA